MIFNGTNLEECFEGLLSDLAGIIRVELTKLGATASNVDDKVLNEYFAIHKRLISQKPRKILKSKQFSCPTNLQSKLTNLEKKIINGEDLIPHCSRAIAGSSKSTKPDQMLNDWNIYHLHFEAKGGLDKLMFVWITDDTVYEIGIYDHSSWNKIEIIEIIKDNWSNLLEPYRMKDVSDISFTPDDNTIKLFRNAQINTSLKLKDGSIYMAPGGGYVCDGTNLDAVLKANCYKQYIHRVLCELIKNPKDYLNWRLDNLVNVNFGLESFNDSIYIVMTYNKDSHDYIQKCKIHSYKQLLECKYI